MMQSTSSACGSPSGWDRLGIGLSGLCILHCVLTPFALAMLPALFASDEMHEAVHAALYVLILPLTLYAMYSGYATHRRLHPPMLLMAGLTVLLLASVPALLAWTVHAETAGALAGSALLVAGHRQNHRAAACCRYDGPPTGASGSRSGRGRDNRR